MKNIIIRNYNHVSIIVLCTAIILLSFILSIKNSNAIFLSELGNFTYQGFCLFDKVMGIPCPTCGLTKSLISISHFKVEDALHYNLAGLFIYILILSQVPYRLLLISINPKMFYSKGFKLFSKFFFYLILFTVTTGWFYKLLDNKFIL